MWEKIKIKLSDRSTLGLPANAIISEDELIFDKKWKNSAVIISGGAGTGKSTILSHFCEEIKKAKPTRWISRINLVDHCEVLSKFEPKMKENNSTEEDTAAIDFFVNKLIISGDKNSFASSLLTHQLKMGDNRVVVMLDGFDEISSQLQEKAIHLMKAITFNKSAQLYVTTRPHMIDQLQFQLSQLAYSLENFTEKDQIDYLSEYWETNLKELEDKSVIIRKFSEYFIQRVSHTLKDKEKILRRNPFAVSLNGRVLPVRPLGYNKRK
jgi:broad-specificity NMP kinase